MTRPILSQDQIHPDIKDRINTLKASAVQEVQTAIARDKIVVVGMAQNPHCKRARKVLNSANKQHHYIEFGSYLKAWRERLALKMWTGWPTFPMVFVDGTLLGGADEITAAIQAGEI